MARKATPKRMKAAEWRPLFLAALSNSGNVRAACYAAKIDRRTAYRNRDASPEFAAAWDVALEDACDVLEAEAWGRARKQSDGLLMFLLKAHRPEKYRETTRQEITGKDGGPVVSVQITAADVVSARRAVAAWEEDRFGPDRPAAG